jgi:hypothetical protein
LASETASDTRRFPDTTTPVDERALAAIGADSASGPTRLARRGESETKRSQAKRKRSDKFRFGFVSASLSPSQAIEILEARNRPISRF